MNARKVLGIGAVALLGVGLLAGCEDEVVPEKTTVRPVRTMKVSDTAAFQRRVFPGRAKATRELDLAFNVAGPLVEYLVKVGDPVPKGELLARLDPATFQAEANRAAAVLKRSKATQKNAKLQMERDEGRDAKPTSVT